MKTIALTKPIKRGKDEVSSVVLREPTAGELRGSSLTNLLQMDVNAHLKVLPRVTDPALAPSEIEGLSPADFLSLAGGLVSFFVTDQQRAQIEATGQPVQ